MGNYLLKPTYWDNNQGSNLLGSSGPWTTNQEGILYDSSNPYESSLIFDANSNPFNPKRDSFDFTNKSDLSRMNILSQFSGNKNGGGLFDSVSNWFSNTDNAEQAFSLGGKVLEGIINWQNNKKTYELGKQALQDRMNTGRAEFLSNAANALDRLKFRQLAFSDAMSGASPESVAKHNQSINAYTNMLGNAGEMIGVNRNQLQPYNQLKA